MRIIDWSSYVCSSDLPELFAAARISLGALGVMTHIELQCIDHYRLCVRSKRVSFGETLTRLTELRREHRNFELHWFPYANMMRQRYPDEVRSAPSSPLTPHRARALFHEQVGLASLRSLARRATQDADTRGKK